MHTTLTVGTAAEPPRTRLGPPVLPRTHQQQHCRHCIRASRFVPGLSVALCRRRLLLQLRGVATVVNTFRSSATLAMNLPITSGSAAMLVTRAMHLLIASGLAAVLVV